MHADLVVTSPFRSINWFEIRSLYVLAYNLKRVIKLLGMPKTLRAMRLLGA